MKDLTGLVICGGESSRMGKDKSLITYYQLPQRYHLYQLLEEFCENIYISCHPRQTQNIQAEFKYIVDDDLYINSGPISSLLSAFHQFPGHAFLAIGCDYPFFTEKEIQHLIHSRDKHSDATIIYNTEDQTPEPLLGIYEASMAEKLVSSFHHGELSIRKILKSSTVKYIQPINISAISSIDTPESYHQALKIINTRE